MWSMDLNITFYIVMGLTDMDVADPLSPITLGLILLSVCDALLYRVVSKILLGMSVLPEESINGRGALLISVSGPNASSTLPPLSTDSVPVCASPSIRTDSPSIRIYSTIYPTVCVSCRFGFVSMHDSVRACATTTFSASNSPVS